MICLLMIVAVVWSGGVYAHMFGMDSRRKTEKNGVPGNCSEFARLYPIGSREG